MAHQMKNLCVFSVFQCVEGAFGAASRGYPKNENGAPQDELKNGVVVDGSCLGRPLTKTKKHNEKQKEKKKIRNFELKNGGIGTFEIGNLKRFKTSMFGIFRVSF